MRYSRHKVDKSSYDHKTAMQKWFVRDTLKLAQQFMTDPEKVKRQSESLCLVCYYRKSRIGGAACTSIQCGMCDTELHFGNTCVDVLCLSCATKTGLCKHCGGDLNMKIRRKVSFDRTPDKAEEP